MPPETSPSSRARPSPAAPRGCPAGPAALIALTLAVGAGAAGPAPNVLLIVGDDHMAEALGCYGSPVARTPRLDRLAARGVRFDAAFCNTPFCTPSRQSLLTGRYPQCVGVTRLTDALDDEAVTLAERLAEAGYRTGAFGKMHFNSGRAHGFETLVRESDWQEWDARGPRRPLPPGLDVLPDWKPFRDPARVWLNSMVAPFGRCDDQMPASFYVRRAVEFIRAEPGRPFFVQVGFQEPHAPFWFPVDFEPRFKPAEMPLPRPGPEDAGRIPRIFADLTPQEKLGIIAAYHTSVAWLDLNVGRLLDALDGLGLADDTLVIYLGDNGYHLGHHGRFEKHTLLERNVRVPLIMRFPGRIPPGIGTPALVELVDVVPTILDYLGLPADRDAPPPRDLHGHSLRPLVEGRVDRLRDAVFSEYRHTEEAMVRTARYKLIYRTAAARTDWYEPVEPPRGRALRLYDLAADPGEDHDLSADPRLSAVVEALTARLADWYRRYPPRGQALRPDLPVPDFLDRAIAIP